MPANLISIYPIGLENHRRNYRSVRFMDANFEQFVKQFDDDVLIINPVFEASRNPGLKLHAVHAAIARYKPKKLIMTCWVEPYWYSDQKLIYEQVLKDYPHHLLGYYQNIENSTWFEFFLRVFDNFMPDYQVDDLLPTAPQRVFTNYNRSLRLHRELLYKQLTEQDLLKHGYVSYVDSVIKEEKLDSTQELYPPRSFIRNDYSPLYKVPNDPFTLGDLDIWNDTIVSVVSDGFWWTSKEPQLFAGSSIPNEKHYKSIVGLRPMLMNTSYSNWLVLKGQGYDLFEDVFNINDTDMQTMESAHSVIVRELTKLSELSSEQRLDWYHSLLPRLLANRELFKERVLYYTQLQKDFRF